jgi:hypothetical protein
VYNSHISCQTLLGAREFQTNTDENEIYFLCPAIYAFLLIFKINKQQKWACQIHQDVHMLPFNVKYSK